MKDALSQFRKVLSLSFFDLKFFTLIFENRSMTAAAKSLDITVSAASHRLSSLRETFDDVLFVRSQPNMVPTSKAHELYPVVCEILGQLERLTAPKEFNPHSLRRTFRVGCVDNALLTVLRRFVEKFYEMAPHCHLEFQPINKNLFKRLEEGKLDAAILPSIHELPPNIREMFLYENAFCLCVRKGHPLIETYRQKGELTPEDLDKVVKNTLKELEQSKPHNSYWMTVLYNYYRTGVDSNDPKNRENLIASITTKDVQAFAKKFFKKADVIDLIFAGCKKEEQTK